MDVLLAQRELVAVVLRFEITGLWHPDGSGGWDPNPPIVYARLRTHSDGQVAIPKGGQRTGEVTISIHDPVAAHAIAYKRMLRAFYYDDPEPVLWGAITMVERDLGNHTIKISAVDRSDPLAHHFLRIGDKALNSDTDPDLPNPWNKHVPANGQGIRMLLDAAQNLAGHQADSYPPLGIAYDGGTVGYDDTDTVPTDTPPKTLPSFSRSDQVWAAVQQITAQEGSTEIGLPDVELAPTVSRPGAYAYLHVFKSQGDYDPLRDRHHTHPLLVHDGWGKDNATVTDATGGKVVTHAHTLSSDDRIRRTHANQAAAGEIGVMVDWNRTGYDIHNADHHSDALDIVAENTLAIWSNPEPTLTVTPRTGWEYRFMRDYMVGGDARLVLRSGQVAEQLETRITQVTLKQADQANNTQELLTVIPKVAPLAIAHHLRDSAFTGADDGVTRIPIDAGFDFTFGSSGVKRLWFPTTDGTLIAADASSDLPTVNYDDTIDHLKHNPDALIGLAVIGADMGLASAAGYSYPGYSGITYATVGTAPNRVFVVTFDLPFLAGNGTDRQHVTAQAQLHEDGTIELHFQTFALDPASALSDLTIGMWWRDSTATDRTLLATIAGHTYNNQWPAAAIPDGQAVRLTPAGDLWSQAACTFAWIDTSTDEDF